MKKFKFHGNEVLYNIPPSINLSTKWTDITDLETWWFWATDGNANISKDIRPNLISSVVHDYNWLTGIGLGVAILLKPEYANFKFDKMRIKFSHKDKFEYIVHHNQENYTSRGTVDMTVDPIVIVTTAGTAPTIRVLPLPVYGEQYIELTIDTVFDYGTFWALGLGVLPEESEERITVYQVEVLNLTYNN